MALPDAPRRARLGVRRDEYGHVFIITADHQDAGYVSARSFLYHESDLPNVGPSVYDDYADPYEPHKPYVVIKHQYPAPTDVTGRPIEPDGE